MKNDDQIGLPIEIQVGQPNTLDPLRRAIDTAEKEAASAIRAIQQHDDMGWFWDEIDPCDQSTTNIMDSAQTLRTEARRASCMRDGYDTWPTKKLSRHILLLTNAAAAFEKIQKARTALGAAELAEMIRQNVIPSLPKE